MKRKSIFFFALAVWSVFAIAQIPKDTVYVVDGGEVIAAREKAYNAGTHAWKGDSALLRQYIPNTLADVLAQQTGMVVRTFTPGTLATPIMRGTYAVHTNVVWNGFSLQSPMNQLIDFNLLPMFFIDGVGVAHGSQSALYGSGAIGGTISIGQQSVADTGWRGTVLLGAGSFNTYQAGAKIGYKNKRYTGKVRYFNQIAQNNYTYTNNAKAGNPVDTLKNAQGWLNGQLFENYFVIKKNIKASVIVWHTQAYRAVPPLMIQQQSVAYQQDDVWRVMGDMKWIGKKAELIIRTQYFDERIRYTNTASFVPVKSDNRAFGILLEGEMRYNITPLHSVAAAINNTYAKSTALNYGSPAPVQYRPSLLVSYRFRSKSNKLFSTLTIRQEAVTLRNTENFPLLPSQLPGKLKMLPIVPTLGVDWNFFGGLWWGTKISRIYRYPSFNDLYWTPGGNSELLPEEGMSAETRLSAKHKTKTIEAGASAGVYYNDINNWVQWLQGQGGIWSPQNIQRVEAKGFEAQADFAYKITSKSELKIDGRYTYTLSTNKKQLGAFDNSYNKQLIYIPFVTALCNVQYRYKSYYIRTNVQYSGKQFLTTDNEKELPRYYVVNFFAGKKVQLKNLQIDINLQGKNITNQVYQMVEWVPMPGRNFLLTLQLNF